MLRLCTAFVSVLFILSSCDDHKSAAPTTPPDQTYTLRAIVTGLPNPPKQALRLHHEAVPNFVGEDGKVEAMEEMEMEFPYLSPGAKLDGIAVGDAIEATMEIRWKSQPPFLLTTIRKLPAGTKLNLGKIEDVPPKK